MSEPLRKSVFVRCSREHAFAVFTARLDSWWPPGHRRWTGSTLRIEPQLGGRFIERGLDGQEAVLGEVVCWEPPDRVTYTWRPGAISEPTEVEVRFREDPGGTRVEVTHREGRSGLGPEWPKRAQRFERAWSEVLPAFERHIEAEREST